jgi:hypothetical protein
MPLLRFTRRATLLSAAFLGAGALLPLPASAADEPKRGGTLVIGSTQTPRHLNGAVQSGIATALPSTQIFASPLRFDDKWNPQPYLAESWKLADDGKSLTLKLRKDAVFHDGKPVTSADVAFSIMAIKANHPFTTMLGPVEKVETPDAYTAIIRMSVPHPAIVLAMSPALCPILPKHIYGDGQDLKNHPRNSTDVVGSGPFRVTDFKPAQRVVLERFDKFFLPGKPYLDKVIVNITPDSASLILGLERGDIQMVPFATLPTDLKRLANDPKVSLTPKGYDGIGALNWLAFNTAKKPLSDVAVRKAIATAIDKNFITKALMGGFATASDGPLVASSPFAVTDLVRYPLDLKKAGEMLDAAGYKAGRERRALQAHHRLPARCRRPAEERGRIHPRPAQEGGHHRRGTGFGRLSGLGQAAGLARLRPVDGHGVQLGRPDHRRAPHLPVDQHQADRLDQHPVVCQPEGRRAAQHRRQPDRRHAAQGLLRDLPEDRDRRPAHRVHQPGAVSHHHQQEAGERADHHLGADVAARRGVLQVRPR